MGLFSLPDKPASECSAEDYVKPAITNLKLFLENPTCDYLLDFAAGMIEDAKKLAKATTGED